MRKLHLAAVAAMVAATLGTAQAADFFVDGVGVAPSTYATINDAITAAGASADPANSIIITVPTLDVPAGILLNPVNGDLTLTSNVPGGSHLRVTATGIGVAGVACALVVRPTANRTINVSNLTITPDQGAAGAVAARAIHFWRVAATGVNNCTVNFDDVIVTAVRPTGHPDAGQPITNPFVHAASADTRAARLAELRAFNGGSANNAVEFRSINTVATDVVTYNFTNFVLTHTITGAPGANGGGFAIAELAGNVVNVNEGSVFSFNDGSAIRTVGSAITSRLNVNGTADNPVIIYKNGWMQDTSSTGRGEGIIWGGTGTAGGIVVDNLYSIGNFAEGIEVTSGNLTASNTVLAENSKTLDTSTTTNFNNLAVTNLRYSAIGGTLNLNNSTIFDGQAASNTSAISIGAGSGTITANLSNVIVAGSGNGTQFGQTATLNITDNDAAFVLAGPDALTAINNVGGTVNFTTNRRVTADPQFVSTTFAPVNAGLGVKPTGIADYLAVGNYGAYSAFREAGASRITGANAAAALTPDLTATAAAIDFGTVNGGDNLTDSVTLGNAGTAPLTITNVSVNNITGAAFSLDAATTGTLAIAATSPVTVRFQPTAAISYVGELVVTSDDPTTPVLTLPLTGVVGSSVRGWIDLND